MSDCCYRKERGGRRGRDEDGETEDRYQSEEPRGLRQKSLQRALRGQTGERTEDHKGVMAEESLEQAAPKSP
jgi:hypothetical protein